MTQSFKKSEQGLHRQKMQAYQQKVDADVTAANIERGVAMLLTGKGKTSSAFDLVVFDEFTYMFVYKYLDRGKAIKALKNRPQQQSEVVTGCGGGRELREIMDAISDVENTQQAYRSALRKNVCLSR